MIEFNITGQHSIKEDWYQEKANQCLKLARKAFGETVYVTTSEKEQIHFKKITQTSESWRKDVIKAILTFPLILTGLALNYFSSSYKQFRKEFYKSRTINVMTYNIGRPWDIGYVEDRFIITNPDYQKKSKDERTEMIQTVFKESIEQGVDIFCLQEAAESEEELKNYINDDNFTFLLDKNNDTAVVWNKNRFSLIADLDENSERQKIVELKNRNNDQVYRIASAHLTGYNIANEKGDMDSDEFGKPFLKKSKGDTELAETISKMYGDDKADLCLIGADTNAPEDHGRHEIFKKSGFIRDTKDKNPTAFNPNVKGVIKLDYIYATTFTGNPPKIKNWDIDKRLPTEDPNNNPSDHSNVIATIFV